MSPFVTQSFRWNINEASFKLDRYLFLQDCGHSLSQQRSDDTQLSICQYHKNAIHLMGCNKRVHYLERFKYHQDLYEAIKINRNNDSIGICCDNIENIGHREITL